MIKSNSTLLLKVSLLIQVFLAPSIFGQSFLTIVFAPGTTDEDKDYADKVVDKMGSFRETGIATENYVDTRLG